jgi:hypothetical protein
LCIDQRRRTQSKQRLVDYTSRLPRGKDTATNCTERRKQCLGDFIRDRSPMKRASNRAIESGAKLGFLTRERRQNRPGPATTARATTRQLGRRPAAKALPTHEPQASPAAPVFCFGGGGGRGRRGDRKSKRPNDLRSSFPLSKVT